jgi:C4-dicarboxylate transporter, DctQ subunit
MQFLHRRAEDFMVLLMAIMFVSFIIQIATRYVFNAPTDWTYELILITWLWSVFWGAAFLLEDKDHVKFDTIYNAGSPKIRRALALLSAGFLCIGFLISTPATWEFISFKSIRSTDMLGIRMDFLFSVYLLFLVSMIIHYGLRIYRLMRGDSMETLEREESL